MAEEKSHVGSIGFNAGQVYNYLEEEEGAMKATEIKKELNFSTSDVYLALGWLAREDQVDVLKKGNSVRANSK